MTTIVGIKTNEGVVLGSDRRASKGFFIGSKITQKIAKIDDTLAVAIATSIIFLNDIMAFLFFKQ